MKLSTLAASILLAGLMAFRAEAAARMAFGYLANTSQDGNYDYLETIMPNSFASSVQNMFRVNVLNPSQINRILGERNLKLEKEYRQHELADVAGALSADYFIYGNFTLLPRESIKINIKFYDHNANKLLTFSNTGKMEAEIFRLVDRIANIMTDFIKENKFFSKTVPRGSKIGIFTNLNGCDLNYLYSSFMGGGYKVASIQANSLQNHLTADSIESFEFITASKNSYEMISDPRTMRFLHGTWTGQKYVDQINRIKKLYQSLDLDYGNAKSGALERLGTYHGIDNILVIGFNRVRNRAWVRCIDARTNDLIWMEANITGSIQTICAKMIDRMTEEIGTKPR